MAGRFAFYGLPVSAASIKSIQNIKPCFSLRKNRVQQRLTIPSLI